MKNDPSGGCDRNLAQDTRIVEASSVVEELSRQEIPKMVHRQVGTLHSQLRGRRRLRKALCGMAEDQGVIAGPRPDEE